jgi:hypothetical protein
MQRINRTAWVLVSAMLSAVGCSNGSNGGVQPGPDRVISVGVYIDRDGSGDPDITEAVGAARIGLLGQVGTDTLNTTSTQLSGGSKGIGVFHDVEVGTYRVTVAASTLGDSLQIEAMELRQQSGSGWLPGVVVDDFPVAQSDDVVYVNLRLVYTQTP